MCARITRFTWEICAILIIHFACISCANKPAQVKQAEAIYKVVAAEQPHDDYTFQAQENLIRLYISSGKEAEAQAALDKFLARFSGHKYIAEALWKIGIAYNRSANYDKAIEVHQYNVEHFPKDVNAVFSQVEIVKSYLGRGDEAAADASVRNFLTVFSGQPTLPKGIYHVARRYDEFKKCDRAIELHQYNVEHFPEDIHAIWSQAEIIFSYIRDGKDDQADAAFDRLLTVFAKQITLPHEIYQVARKYSDAGKTEKALSVHQYNVEHFPDNINAMWSQAEIVFSHIRDANDSAANAAFDKLVSTFSNQPTLPKEVYEVAKRYSTAGNTQKANQLYQRVIDRCTSDTNIHSRNVLVMSYIHLGLDTQAQSAIESLIKDFKDHPELPVVLCHASEAYYSEAVKYEKQGQEAKAKDYFAKVISLGERLRQQGTPYTEAAEAWFFSADCYYRLGQYERAKEYYRTVINKFPGSQYAWLSHLKIADIYKWLLKEGVMSESEVEEAMAVSYQQLVKDFPNCPAAQGARTWLANYAKSKEGEQK